MPPRGDDHSIQQLHLPDSLLATRVPTQVLWGMDDVALRPELLNGLEQWVPHLTVEPVPRASHWLVHEQPAVVIRSLHQLLLSALTHRTAPAPTQSASTADLPLDY